MNIGDIYQHDAFQFTDGNTGRKLFVIVSNLSEEKSILVCKTTSRERPPYRLRRKGCAAPKRNYYMFDSREDWFNQDTWVQFNELYEFKVARLLKDKFGGKTRHAASMKEKNIRALLNCILKSEAISAHYANSIKKAAKQFGKHNISSYR